MKRMDKYKCEASIGMIPDFKPTIRLCGKEAKLYGIAALCDEHKSILKEKKNEKNG